MQLLGTETLGILLGNVNQKGILAEPCLCKLCFL